MSDVDAMGGFKPSSWSQDARDLAKEYDSWDKEQTAAPEIQTEPEEISKSMVRRGTMDARTGAMTGSMKQSKILRDNAKGFSPQGKLNYERTFGHG